MDENGSIDKNLSILKMSGNEVHRLRVKLLIFEAKAIKFQDKILCYFRGEWGRRSLSLWRMSAKEESDWAEREQN